MYFMSSSHDGVPAVTVLSNLASRIRQRRGRKILRARHGPVLPPLVQPQLGTTALGPTWGVRGIDGPIRAVVDVLVEPVTGSGSRLTISVDFTGHGIGKILVPLMVRREARKEMPANMAALKQNMEAG